ncbi:hypothetical protein GCM10009605_09370 [Nocardiopsis composta]
MARRCYGDVEVALWRGRRARRGGERGWAGELPRSRRGAASVSLSAEGGCDTRGMDDGAKAFLEGGPGDLRERVVAAESSGTEIKIPFQGGYEHFTATPRQRETTEGRLQVYEWSSRTEIAE